MEQSGTTGVIFEALLDFVQNEQSIQKPLGGQFFPVQNTQPLLSFIGEEEIMQENMRIVLTLIVEDLFRNLRSYLGSVRSEPRESDLARQEMKKEELKSKLHESEYNFQGLNRDFIEPNANSLHSNN